MKIGSRWNLPWYCSDCQEEFRHREDYIEHICAEASDEKK